VLGFAFSKPGTPDIKTLAFGMSRVLAWVILILIPEGARIVNVESTTTVDNTGAFGEVS